MILQYVNMMRRAKGGLIPTGGYALASTRIALPGATTTSAAGSSTYPKAEVAMGMPPWSGKLRLLLPALIAANGAFAALGNDLSFNWITVVRGTTEFYPVTVGGNVAFTLADLSLTWSDEVAGLTTVPNEMLHVRFELNMDASTKYPVGMQPVLGGQDLVEARFASTITSPNPGLRTGGVIAPTTASNAQVWAPAAAAVSGYNGATPVWLVIGDSRAVGQNDPVVRLATRGCMGELARGLDDAASGRIAFGNFGIRGLRADNLDANLGLVWTALNALPNRLYQNFGLEIGGNDYNNNGANPTPTLADMQARFQALWAALRVRAPGAVIYQFYGHPWTTDTSGNLYGRVADQVPLASSTDPTGVQQQTEAWFRTRVGIGSDVVLIDLGAGFQAPGFPDRWDAPDIAGTLVNAVSSGRAITASFPDAPPIGSYIVLPGTGVSQSRLISDVQGAFPNYLITTADAVTTTNSAGATVRQAYVSDGIHQGQVVAKRAAAIIAARKLDGTIKTS